MTDKKKINYGKCSGCGAKIVWLKTSKEKPIPVDPEGVEPEHIYFNPMKHKIHFAICPEADKFRRSKTIHERRRENADNYKNGYYPSAEEIAAEREKLDAEFKEKLSKDRRPFIIHNQVEITIPRYALLNTCAELGLEYDALISWKNEELREWLGDRWHSAPQEVKEPELFAC